MSPSQRELLDFRSVSKTFRVRRGFRRNDHLIRAVEDVSLTVKHRESVAIVGESGSGKSTLIRLLLGLETLSAGEIWADGTQIAGVGAPYVSDVRKWMQPVFQDPSDALNPRMRIGSLVSEPLRVNEPRTGPDRARERVLAALSEVGLNEKFADRFPHQLSGGQRQRVAIARALVLKPRALILDEPVSALDVSISAQVLNLLKDLRLAHEIAYVVVTHNLATVGYIADRILVMRRGRIVEEGSCRDVLENPQHDYTKTLIRAASSRVLTDADIRLFESLSRP